MKKSEKSEKSNSLRKVEEALRKTEERYHNLFSFAPMGIYLSTRDGKFITVNAKLVEILGYDSIEELMQVSIENDIYWNENERELLISKYESIGSVNNIEVKWKKKDNTPLWILLNTHIVKDELNNFLYFEGFVQDITDRKYAEEAIHILSERQETILAAIPDIIMEVDNDKVYTFANQAGREFFGDDVIGKEAAYYFEGEQDTYDMVIPIFKGSEDIIYVENWQRRKDGEKHLLAWWCRVIKDAKGNVKGALSTARDITENKKDEEKIIRLNRVYAVISQINQAIIHLENKDELFREVCRIAVECGNFHMAWIGLIDERSMLINQVAYAGVEDGFLSEIVKISVQDSPEGQGPTGTAARNGRPEICNDIENDPRMAIWKDETLKRNYRSLIALPILFSGHVIGTFTLYSTAPDFFKQEEITLLVEVTNDIGFALDVFEAEEKRKQTGKELLESEEKYRNIFETTLEGIYQSTPDGLYNSVNPAFAGMFGYSSPGELIESTFDIGVQFYVDPSQRLKFKQLHTDNGIVKGFEVPLYKKDKSIFWGQINSKAIKNDQGDILYYQGGMIDITERRKAEEEIKRVNSFLDSIIENIPNMIFLKDVNELRYVRFNRAGETLLGIPEEEMLGKNDYDLFSKEQADIFTDYDMEVLRNRKMVDNLDQPVQTKNRGLRYLHTKKVPILNAKGEPEYLLGISEDITELRKTEKALRESEEKYRNIFDNVQDVFYQTDLTGIVRDVSPSINNFTEFSRDDLIGKPVVNIYFDAYDRSYLIDELMKNGEVRDYELRLRTKAGEKKYVSINARLIYDADGNPDHIDGALRDITERIQAEQKLRDSEYFFRESQSAAFIGSYKTDFKTGLWESSEVMDQIFGIDQDYIRSVQGWLDIVHPDDRELMDRYLKEEVISKHKPFNYQYRIVRRSDGAVRWVHGLGQDGFDPEGNVISMIGTIQDITDRKQTENALIESEDKFRSMTERTSDLIAITDEQGIITYASPASVSLFQFEPEEMCNHNFIEFLNESYIPKAFEAFRRSVEMGEMVKNLELLMKRRDGSQFFGELNGSIFQYGMQNGTLVVIRDITERKRTQEELISAKEKAEESNRLKSAFLANMSHEIRTPMNGILGFAELLKQPDLSGERQQEYIRIIEKSGARMLNIINDIISISKVESGLMDVSISETNVSEQIEYIYSFFKPEVEQKGLQLICRNPRPVIDVTINTDREKIYAVLANLVKNAIKFTNTGSIEFGYEKKDNYLEFFVKDTGIGIPKDRQEAVFERFIQADIDDRRASQGAGLGLSISKAYVEMLGGKIWMESEPGKGSEFYFTIPYNTKPDKYLITNVVPADGAKNLTKNLKILIAEDDESSAFFISIVIKKISSEVIFVRTGIEAIETCRNTPDIDLVLMDIQMPEMDGYEATRQIRQFNKSVVIIAQTAFGLAEDGENAIKAGCSDYISKPVNRALLISVIKKHF